MVAGGVVVGRAWRVSAATMAKPTVSELSGDDLLVGLARTRHVAAVGAQLSPSTSPATLVIRMPIGLGYEPLVWNVRGERCVRRDQQRDGVHRCTAGRQRAVHGERQSTGGRVERTQRDRAHRRVVGRRGGRDHRHEATCRPAARGSRLGLAIGEVPSLYTWARNLGWSPMAQARLAATAVRKQFEPGAPVGRDERHPRRDVDGVGRHGPSGGDRVAARPVGHDARRRPPGWPSAFTVVTIIWFSTAKSCPAPGTGGARQLRCTASGTSR